MKYINMEMAATFLSSMLLVACGGGGSGGSAPAERSVDPSTSNKPALNVDGPQKSDQPVSKKNTKLGTRFENSERQKVLLGDSNAKWNNYSREEEYPRTITLPTQWVEMDDGAELAVSVTLPADNKGKAINQRFPVVLIQTPYNSLVGGSVFDALGTPNPVLVKRGYANIVVDVRGTGSSSGRWDFLGKREQKDSYALIEWASQQSWSNGVVGTYGGSYLGTTAISSATSTNPALKAAFSIVPIGDLYRDFSFSGGQPNANFTPLWRGFISLMSGLPVDKILSNPSGGLSLAFSSLFQNSIDQSKFMVDVLSGGDNSFDNEFWAERSMLEQARNVQVPSFFVGGSYDLMQRSAPLWFEAMKENVNTKVLIGPWSHTEAVDFLPTGLPKNNIPSISNIALQWFDYYLKGMDTGAPELPNMTQWVHGVDEYVTTTDWPHPKMSPKKIYLQSTGELLPDFPQSDYGFNSIPQAPFFGLCSSYANQMTMGITSLLPTNCFNENNVFNLAASKYQTDPLVDDLYINGPIQANLWVSTNAPDMGLAVHLDHVNPSTGKVTRISAGGLMASKRNVDTEKSRFVDDEMIQPWHTHTKETVKTVVKNEPMLMQVELFQNAVRIPKGHRLRLSVSASDIWMGNAPLYLGRIKIYANSEFQSSLVLPEVPTGEIVFVK